MVPSAKGLEMHKKLPAASVAGDNLSHLNKKSRVPV